MLIACSIFRQKLPLTVMFNNNSSSRRQEYSKLLSSNIAVQAHYVTTVYNYTRTKVPSFYEQIWQLIITEQS